MAESAGTQAVVQLRSAGTLPQKRRRLRWPEGRDFRILSLDGGGIKGLYTAAVLAQLERDALGGGAIGQQFDLVAGTSTGGIIALGLSAGRSATEILELYLQHGASIFPRKAIAGIFRPAFKPRQLRTLLEAVLGERTIGEAHTRLCIPSCEGRYGEVNVFKTPHHPDFRSDWKHPMVEAAMATSAAPTFLPVHSFGDYFYIDGGLWANNPVMVAVVDAVSCYDIRPEQIRVFSIGTGARSPALDDKHLGWGGVFSWILSGDLIEQFMNFSGQNADGQAGLLIGRDRLLRIAPQGEAALVHMTDYPSAVRLSVPAGVADAAALLDRFSAAFGGSQRSIPEFFHGPQATDEAPNWTEPAAQGGVTAI